MNTISFRLDKSIEKKIDQTIQKHTYSTKTEFIREAIRDKIKSLESAELIKKMYVASKRKTTDKQLHEVREKIAQELIKKLQ